MAVAWQEFLTRASDISINKLKKNGKIRQFLPITQIGAVLVPRS